MTTDILTAKDYGIASPPDFTAIETTNLLLRQLIRAVQKTHPSQRCVLDISYSNPTKLLTDQNDTADIRFLASGKPVKALYLSITNNTSFTVNVGLNEPVSENANGFSASGIQILNSASWSIPVEIEKIQIKLLTNQTGKAISVGNTPSGIPTDGTISVYAWTIPNSDKDETE